jgi:hypothetical protein
MCTDETVAGLFGKVVSDTDTRSFLCVEEMTFVLLLNRNTVAGSNVAPPLTAAAGPAASATPLSAAKLATAVIAVSLRTGKRDRIGFPLRNGDDCVHRCATMRGRQGFEIISSMWMQI